MSISRSRIGSWKTRHQSRYSSGPLCSDLFLHSSQLLATGADGGAKSGPTAHPVTVTRGAAVMPRPNKMTATRAAFPLSSQAKVARKLKAERKAKAGRARSHRAKGRNKE